MPYVKLDTDILDSTLWIDREGRDVFITALLLAQPFEVVKAMPAYEKQSLATTGFVVPPGWYGFVRAAGSSIIRRATVPHEAGMAALDRLAAEDPESRSVDHGGRRMVRVDGGFIILNFFKYRDRDHTSATRQKNYRDRKKTGAAPQMELQDGRCGCCGKEFEQPYSLYVVQDHDHRTQKSRDLVCQSCNKLIGQVENGEGVAVLRDEISRYLERHGSRNGRVTLRDVTEVVGSKHEAEAKNGTALRDRDAGAAAILALWNGMAEEIGYAKVIAVKGKRLAAFNARLVEPGWPENARKAIAYLQGDAWYRSKPDAIRFDVLIRPGKVEEYIERSGVKRGNGNGVAQSRGGARREVDAAFGEQLNDSDAGTRRAREDDKPVF